jgi:hypothetical protein
MNKLTNLLSQPHARQGQISRWNDGTIDRIIDILQGQGESWRRDDQRYRDHVAGAKY